MKYDHGKMMVDPEELNLALSLADEAGEQLSRGMANMRRDPNRLTIDRRRDELRTAAMVAQACEARALRLTLVQLADDHEYNADRRADR